MGLTWVEVGYGPVEVNLQLVSSMTLILLSISQRPETPFNAQEQAARRLLDDTAEEICGTDVKHCSGIKTSIELL